MTIRLADHHQESQLRELLRGSAMPGWVRLAFGREPDFFQAVGVQGKTNQVLIALERERVVGMGGRSLKPLFINGAPIDFGYLGGLRLHPEVRRTGLLARGYAALKRLHKENPVPAYLTTIIEDNTEVRRLLTSGRVGLPHYLDHGRYVTYAVSLNARRRNFESPLEIRRGDAVGLDAILRFLAEMGRQRQFFPVLAADDFGSPYLRGLSPADFRVALDAQGEIAGVAAVWDQNAFKQNIVEGYAAPIRMIRPMLNVALRLAGVRTLPPEGRTLDSLYIAFPCARGDDPQVLRALLERIYAEHQHGGHHFLLVGLHERDPLAAALHHFRAFLYLSRLYLVCWADGVDFVRKLDPARIPHLELATL
jgi:hypothetical protein